MLSGSRMARCRWAWAYISHVVAVPRPGADRARRLGAAAGARHAALAARSAAARPEKQLDTEGKINRARCKTFIAHSEGDRTVRFAHGQAVFAAARKPKRFAAVPGNAHILPLADDRDYAREILEFLRVR